MSPVGTRIQCPGSWYPWERLDPKAIRRGSTYIRWMPLPVYAYVVAEQFKGYQIIEPFRPFITNPKHHKAADHVLEHIDPLAWVSHQV